MTTDHRSKVLDAMSRFHKSQTPKPAKPRKPRQRGALLSCGCRSEEDEQRDLVKALGVVGHKVHWVRNEQGRNVGPRIMQWIKARGFKPGFPDLISLTHPGLVIELKAKCKRHRLSDSQRIMRDYMRSRGWSWVTAHGCQDALEQLEEAGLLRPSEGDMVQNACNC